MSPTPEEAQHALRDVDLRREQTVAASSWSRWAWIATGVTVAAYGLLVDQQPEFFRSWGSTITALLLLAVVASNTRWGSALLRRPVRPRTRHDPASMLWSALVLVLIIGAVVVADVLDVPHVSVWAGLAGGVLLAAVGPWWQRRVLTRGTRR